MRIVLGNYSDEWQTIGTSYTKQDGKRSLMLKEGTESEINEIAAILTIKGIAYTTRRLYPSPVWQIESTLQGDPNIEFTDDEILLTETWSKDFGVAQIDWKEHPTLTAVERRLDAVIGSWIEKHVSDLLEDPDTTYSTDFTDGLSVAGATTEEQTFLDGLIKDVARGLKVVNVFPMILTKSLTLPETTNYAESDDNEGKFWSRSGLLLLEPNIPNYIQAVMKEGYYMRMPVRVTQLSDGKKQFDLSYEWTADFARSVYTVVA